MRMLNERRNKANFIRVGLHVGEVKMSTKNSLIEQFIASLIGIFVFFFFLFHFFAHFPKLVT